MTLDPVADSDNDGRPEFSGTSNSPDSQVVIQLPDGTSSVRVTESLTMPELMLSGGVMSGREPLDGGETLPAGSTTTIVTSVSPSWTSMKGIPT